MSLLLLLLLLLLAIIVSMLFSWQYKNWLFVWHINGWRGIFQQPRLWYQIIAHLEPKSLLQMITRMRRQFKRPLAVIFGHMVLIYVDDPVTMEQILNASESRDKSFLQDGFVLRRGLLHARGAKWKQRRRQFDPAFNSKVLLSFIDVFNDVGNKLVGKFTTELQGDAVPFKAIEALLCRAVLEASFHTTMGCATNLTEKDEHGIAANYSELMQLSALRGTKMWLQNDFIFRLLDPHSYKRTNEILVEVERFVKEIVQRKHAEWQEKKCQGAQATTNSNNCGQMMQDAATALNATDADKTDKISTADTTTATDAAVTAAGKRIFIDQIFYLVDNGEMPLQEVMDEALSMVMVSFETISTSLGVALLCLAMHPDCQRKLRDELRTAFGASNENAVDAVGHINVELLQQLKYLDMVVNESLRLLTTVPFNTRVITQDYGLRVPRPGSAAKATTAGASEYITVTVPRGTAILIDTFNMQREVALWGPHAKHFHPEHFAAGAAPTQRHPYAFIPFSKGVRYCIGSRYSMYLAKLFLAKLVYHCEFETSFKLEDLVFMNGISLKFENSDSIKLGIHKVTHATTL